jgi:excisionase family DNA binding protein
MKIELERHDIEHLSNKVAEIVFEKLKDHSLSKREEDTLLTVDELAGYLKVKKTWIYQRVHAKEIPYHKVGNKLRFRKSEIDNDL